MAPSHDQIPTTRILCHRDIRDTICPGENFPYHWVLWEVERYRPVVRARMALTGALEKCGDARTKKPRSAYALKRDAIQHSLYGVDIDPGAVEIAKLRLWLSMVVD